MSGIFQLQKQAEFLTFSKEKQEQLVARDYQEAVQMQIDRLLEIKTPLAQRLYTWVNKNLTQTNWYLENINHIELHLTSMTLFGEYILGGDFENLQTKTFIWDKNEISCSLPDWKKIITHFPEKTWESFFSEVLHMSGKYLGSSSDTIRSSKDKVILLGSCYTRGKLRRK